MPTFKMGMPDTIGLSLEKKVEALENTVADLISRLSWITSKFDSKNVKRLDTNETSIKSADGETVITGPVLEMYDKQVTPKLRLKQGYDATTDTFLFALYNAAGNQTVGIDASGDAIFTGTITGGTIRTAADGRRIELSSNSLFAYDVNGVARIELRPIAGSPNYYEIWFRGQAGLQVGTLSGTDGKLNVYGTDTLILGGANGIYFAAGDDIYFQAGSTVDGLDTDSYSQADHDHAGYTGFAGDGITMPSHRHTISDDGGFSHEHAVKKS